MTTMLDRVARAIADADMEDYEGAEQLYNAKARAALAAMRDPTDAMMDAINEHAGSIAPEYAYRDAIDAALLEQQP